MNAQASTLRWWAILTLLMLLVFGLRVWDLTLVPPGITHDEASNGHDSAAILQGEHHLYFPVGYGHEPLYNYSVALATAILGQSIFTLRITTVAWGMAQCVFTLALARRWWGRTAALAVAGAYAANFWSLMLARVGLRAATLPALLAASVLCYDHAIHTHSGNRRLTSPCPNNSTLIPRPINNRRAGKPIVYYVASGLFLGASLYTYMASRGMPLLFIVFLIALAIVDRSKLKEVWGGTLGVIAVAAVLSAPLFVYLHQHPNLEQRISQLGAAIETAMQGNWPPLAENVLNSLPMLVLRGDPQWLYNIAGRPALEPILTVLFGIGLLYAISHLRNHRVLLTLIWLTGGIAPALLVSVDYNLLHGIAAMPAVMLLIGAGTARLNQELKRDSQQWRAIARVALTIACVGGFALTARNTARAYFITWPQNRNVRVAYHHHVVALGRYLDTTAERSPAVITTLYPGEFHDPYTMEMALREDDQDLRWADGRSALFVPATISRLFVEEQTHPSASLWQTLTPDLEPLVSLQFRKDDLPAKTEGYKWNSPATWQRLLAQSSNTLYVAPGDPPLPAAHREIRCPLSFDQVLTLKGYTWDVSPTPDGTSLMLTSYWEVTDTVSADLAVFAHVLTPTGDLVAQDDRLGAPSWQWQPGDRFLQQHQVDLPEDSPPGSYHIALGIYDGATLLRLPLITDPPIEIPGATRVLIPLEIQ